MEDRRHTEPWTAARPSGVPAPGDVETTIKHPKPAPRSDTDERVRGLSIDGRYEIGDCIGAGGMSRVYSGVHTQTGVRVAIKLIDPALSQEPSTKQRLLGEARAMMELQSSHIVRAHDVGAVPSGQLYVVMEFLDGENLDAILTREGPLSWPRVAAIGAQVCSGLATAHRRKIIHRDIKPQNLIRVAVDGNPEHIKIIDFGVAREVRVEVGPTEQGMLPGTPEYMAPELVQQRDIRANERTDLYAVGVTLYKLLTGRLPFQGATYMETLRRHIGEPLTPPSVAAPGRGIPPEADALLIKLLAKDPAERFASADELAAALRSGRGTPPPADATAAAHRLAPGGAVGPRSAAPSPAIAAEGLGTLPSVVPSEITEPPRPRPRPLDRRFVLLRMSTLVIVSALFTVGTFVIRPRAEGAPDAIAPPAPIVARRDPAPAMPAPTTLPPTETTPPITEPPPAEPAPPPVERPPEAEPPVVESPPAPGPTVDDPPIALDPEAPPAPVTPSGPTTPTEPTAPPEPNFGYAAARKLIEEQQVYLRNECMGKKAKTPLARLKFRFDVRPDGRSVISVYSGQRDVRRCVRDLFKFPFDESPRGGAFEYNLTTTGGSLKQMPVDPEKVK